MYTESLFIVAMATGEGFFKMINQCVLLLTCIPLSNKIQLLTSVYEVEHCVDVLGTCLTIFFHHPSPFHV